MDGEKLTLWIKVRNNGSSFYQIIKEAWGSGFVF
jgi:hypothetical protein